MWKAILQYEIHCLDDCLISWCPKHHVEIKFTDVSWYLSYYKDWEIVFWMDTREFIEFIKSAKELSDMFVSIDRPK